MVILRAALYPRLGMGYQVAYSHLGNLFFEYQKDLKIYLGLVLIAALQLYFRKDRLPTAQAPVDAVAQPRSLAVPTQNGERLIAIKEIDYLEAAGNYVRVHSMGNRYLLRSSLKAVMEQLPEEQFVRLHRSFLANTDKLREFRSSGTRQIVEMRDGAELPGEQKVRKRRARGLGATSAGLNVDVALVDDRDGIDSAAMATGSIICPSCGKLVSSSADKCPFCGRVRPGMFGLATKLQRMGGDFGVTQVVVGVCVLLYVLTLVYDLSAIRGGGLLGMLSPGFDSIMRFGASSWVPVIEYGRWWTVLSAGWLHGGLLHIFFNVMWLRQLVPVTAAIYGTGRSLTLLILSSVAGFMTSTGMGFLTYKTNSGLLASLMGSGHVTVGASAAIFGLLGAVVYAGRRGIASSLGRTMWQYAIALFVLSAFIPHVDNWAHLGGFVGGYAIARLMDPYKPERADQLLTGLVLAGVSLLAVVWSFFSPLS